MIFYKIFVLLFVVCAVCASEEDSGNSTETLDETSINGNYTDSDAAVTELKITEASSETVDPVETRSETPVVRGSSAQLQVNNTDTSTALPPQIGISPCFNDSQCENIANGYCKEAICHCKQFFIPHPDNATVCIKMANKIGDNCEISKQCETVGICKNGVCALEHIESARIPLSSGLNAGSLGSSGSFFIFLVTCLFLVY